MSGSSETSPEAHSENTEKVETEVEEEEEYNSDDPENWGPYYWSQADTEETGGSAAPTRKVWDNVKYYSFKGYRNVNFAGEVLVHFFGLNQSRYQWMIDLAKREAEEEELRLKEIEQRRQYRLDKKLKKEKASVEKMEGQ